MQKKGHRLNRLEEFEIYKSVKNNKDQYTQQDQHHIKSRLCNFT